MYLRHDEKKSVLTKRHQEAEAHDEEHDEKEAAQTKLDDEPKNTEKDILRYYYYIQNGIDTEHVAPLENARIENVMSLLTEMLKTNHPQLVVDLSDEVREDYLLSVKKAIVDFVLRDSKELEAEQAKLKLSIPEYKLELDIVPKPWHQSFERARNEMSKNLHSINPCMSQVLKLWHISFK